MPSITAEPRPEIGGVQLTIITHADLVSLERADAYGTAPVRTRENGLEVQNTLDTKTNVLPNPSFETDLAGWTLQGVTGTATASFSQMVQVGTKQAQLASDGSTSLPGICLMSSAQRPAVAAGKWVGFRAFAATEGGGYQTRLQLTFRDAAGASISSATSAWVDSPFYTGTQHQLVAQAPASTASVSAYVLYRDGTNTAAVVPVGKRLWVDACCLVTADTEALATERIGEYFEGTVTVSSIILTDYEPAHGGVIYTATDAQGVTGQASVQFTLDSPWLFVPVLPNYSSKLQTVTTYSARGQSLGTVHQPPGRQDPVVVLRAFGSKQGRIGLWAGTHQDAQALYNTISRGEVLMLRQPEHQGMDMYFIAQDADIEVLAVAGAGTVWGVQLSYTQVARPRDPLGGALGWTFASVSASAASFAELRTKYATFEDLRLNEQA